jgi:hypothetical protein
MINDRTECFENHLIDQNLKKMTIQDDSSLTDSNNKNGEKENEDLVVRKKIKLKKKTSSNEFQKTDQNKTKPNYSYNPFLEDFDDQEDDKYIASNPFEDD